MDITSLIVEAVSGAVGGNVAGAAMKEKSLGAIGNSACGTKAILCFLRCLLLKISPCSVSPPSLLRRS